MDDKKTVAEHGVNKTMQVHFIFRESGISVGPSRKFKNKLSDQGSCRCGGVSFANETINISKEVKLDDNGYYCKACGSYLEYK